MSDNPAPNTQAELPGGLATNANENQDDVDPELLKLIENELHEQIAPKTEEEMQIEKAKQLSLQDPDGRSAQAIDIAIQKSLEVQRIGEPGVDFVEGDRATASDNPPPVRPAAMDVIPPLLRSTAMQYNSTESKKQNENMLEQQKLMIAQLLEKQKALEQQIKQKNQESQQIIQQQQLQYGVTPQGPTPLSSNLQTQSLTLTNLNTLAPSPTVNSHEVTRLPSIPAYTFSGHNRIRATSNDTLDSLDQDVNRSLSRGSNEVDLEDPEIKMRMSKINDAGEHRKSENIIISDQEKFTNADILHLTRYCKSIQELPDRQNWIEQLLDKIRDKSFEAYTSGDDHLVQNPEIYKCMPLIILWLWAHGMKEGCEKKLINYLSSASMHFSAMVSLVIEHRAKFINLVHPDVLDNFKTVLKVIPTHCAGSREMSHKALNIIGKKIFADWQSDESMLPARSFLNLCLGSLVENFKDSRNPTTHHTYRKRQMMNKTQDVVILSQHAEGEDQRPSGILDSNERTEASEKPSGVAKSSSSAVVKTPPPSPTQGGVASSATTTSVKAGQSSTITSNTIYNVASIRAEVANEIQIPNTFNQQAEATATGIQQQWEKPVDNANDSPKRHPTTAATRTLAQQVTPKVPAQQACAKTAGEPLGTSASVERLLKNEIEILKRQLQQQQQQQQQHQERVINMPKASENTRNGNLNISENLDLNQQFRDRQAAAEAASVNRSGPPAPKTQGTKKPVDLDEPVVKDTDSDQEVQTVGKSVKFKEESEEAVAAVTKANTKANAGTGLRPKSSSKPADTTASRPKTQVDMQSPDGPESDSNNTTGGTENNNENEDKTQNCDGNSNTQQDQQYQHYGSYPSWWTTPDNYQSSRDSNNNKYYLMHPDTRSSVLADFSCAQNSPSTDILHALELTNRELTELAVMDGSYQKVLNPGIFRIFTRKLLGVLYQLSPEDRIKVAPEATFQIDSNEFFEDDFATDAMMKIKAKFKASLSQAEAYSRLTAPAEATQQQIDDDWRIIASLDADLVELIQVLVTLLCNDSDPGTSEKNLTFPPNKNKLTTKLKMLKSTTLGSKFLLLISCPADESEKQLKCLKRLVKQAKLLNTLLEEEVSVFSGLSEDLVSQVENIKIEDLILIAFGMSKNPNVEPQQLQRYRQMVTSSQVIKVLSQKNYDVAVKIIIIKSVCSSSFSGYIESLKTSADLHCDWEPKRKHPKKQEQEGSNDSWGNANSNKTGTGGQYQQQQQQPQRQGWQQQQQQHQWSSTQGYNQGQGQQWQQSPQQWAQQPSGKEQLQQHQQSGQWGYRPRRPQGTGRRGAGYIWGYQGTGGPNYYGNNGGGWYNAFSNLPWPALTQEQQAQLSQQQQGQQQVQQQGQQQQQQPTVPLPKKESVAARLVKIYKDLAKYYDSLNEDQRKRFLEGHKQIHHDGNRLTMNKNFCSFNYLTAECPFGLQCRRQHMSGSWSGAIPETCRTAK